ncbi:Transcriptional regulatory protein, C terminal [Serratia fonticola]|uniref:winged helix-turn-helix domain-containing protein n=1 Tax=Serratia fonticola TaxID=47917 RepID=UPI000FADEDF0|nr:winged helix-turn-helix domain-containing protein [Serratia fonticola]CAI2537942.1 Transcriptional regulatory protein, C terminal [Serratia fonticola]
MLYIINGVIQYSPKLKELSLVQEEQNSLVLSNQASRLLMELIKNAGNDLTRDYLLKHTWEDFGLTPSNNNLYSAVSELRKAISSLGITEKFIITIPKVGFKFNCSIDFLPTETNATKKESEEIKKISLKDNKLVNLFFAFCITAFVILYYSIVELKEIEIKKSTPSLVEVFEKCHIYSLDNPLLHIRDKILHNVLERANFKEECKTKGYNIYYSDLKSIDDYVFIGACLRSPNNKNTKCFSIRYD